MIRNVNNLVFEGGGILGIAYLGVLDYLSHNGWMKALKRTAGTSAGALTACITSFALPFEEISKIAGSLDYSKITSKTDQNDLDFISSDIKEIMEQLFGDINCIYRLMNHYGWYSTQYLYDWMKDVIASQFDPSKKLPPYTFSDFHNSSLHKNNRPFLDLSIIGTNLTMKKSQIFSYETTPLMEVAQAVRISTSIPLLFEAVESEDSNISGNNLPNVYCDGGALNNYPLSIFDSAKYNPHPFYGINMDTLGVRFQTGLDYKQIDDLIGYIENLLHLSSYIQEEIYESNPLNKERSIIIDTKQVSPLDFNVEMNDPTYRFLYYQGYIATKAFFERKR